MENLVIKTPNGHEVTIKSYLTGRMQREIDNVALSATSITLEDGKPNIGEIQTSMVRDMEDKQIELLVVSVDGETEQILDKVLDLPSVDYNTVLEKINGVVSNRGLSKDKKK